MLLIFRDAHSTVFQYSRGLLLEKFLLLLGVCFYYGSNLAEFRPLLHSFIQFTDSLVRIPSVEQLPRPVIKAHLLCIQAMLTAWPDYLPTIEYLDYVVRTSRHLEAILEAEVYDVECQLSAAASLVIIQERADPARLLREAAEAMTLDIEQVKLPTSRPSPCPSPSIPMATSTIHIG